MTSMQYERTSTRQYAESRVGGTYPVLVVSGHLPILAPAELLLSLLGQGFMNLYGSKRLREIIDMSNNRRLILESSLVALTMCNSRPSGFHPFYYPVHFSLLYLGPYLLNMYTELIESRGLRFHVADVGLEPEPEGLDRVQVRGERDMIEGPDVSIQSAAFETAARCAGAPSSITGTSSRPSAASSSRNGFSCPVMIHSEYF